MSNNNMLTKPSYLSLVFTGIMILYILFILFLDKNNHDPNFVITLILFSILIGIHGILHLGLEKNYGYNPLETSNFF